MSLSALIMTQPIRIAILDSGVHLTHPHISGVVGGADCTDSSEPGRSFPECCIDRLGHGTAVTALIHYLAPEAELLIVRIFERQLTTSLPIVLRAINWSLEQNVHLLNLSFGTANPAHRIAFEAAIRKANEKGVLVISAWEDDGHPVLPGSLPTAVGVVSDRRCDEGNYHVIHDEKGIRYAAAPYPRSIPGIPRERNLTGVSFATASISAQIASLWRVYGAQPNWHTFLREHEREQVKKDSRLCMLNQSANQFKA